jgi:serine phosphatase RsbU (regulator of sigma subunit)/pSer/pThr/pTyr-binding forkhead associated (FHA) protein
MPSLIVTSGVLAGQVFSFSDTAVIGRGQFSEVRLNDPTVSRRHALIRRNGQDYELRDQDSANGTQYKGQRLSEPVRIHDGDELQFGEVKTVFRSAVSEQPSLPALTLPSVSSTRAGAVVDPQRAAESAAVPGLRDLLARLKLLCDVGALARQPQEVRDLLNQALGAVLAAFPQVSRAAIHHRSTGAEQLVVLAARANPSASPEFAEIDAFLQEASRLENGLNITDADAREALAARLRVSALPAALLGMPLRLGEELVGMLYLESAIVEHAWRAADHELFVGVAGQLAWLIASNRTQSPERVIEAHDLALARRIQQHFLPQAAPRIPGYRIADSHTTARVIGGDYYDFFHFKDGRQGIVIADVSGKAISGALYMARLSVQVRVLARNLAGPEELLAGLNRKLNQELEPGMFVTMFAAALEPDAAIMEFANAGHPVPLLRNPDGSVGTLGEPGALPLGAMSDATFRQRTVALPQGGCVLFYTDGLDGARNTKKECFGRDRIVKALADSGGGAQAALDALLTEIARFSDGEPLSDDVTLITLAREPH